MLGYKITYYINGTNKKIFYGLADSNNILSIPFSGLINNLSSLKVCQLNFNYPTFSLYPVRLKCINCNNNS